MAADDPTQPASPTEPVKLSAQHLLQWAAFSLEDDQARRARARRRARAIDGRVVIEVRDLDKRFRIPTQRSRTIKHPRGVAFRELRALRGVSFDVRRGEFFGVVGRNGSGKSTLLKVMASIYRADRGRVRVAGRLAPFIELGVGFNPELTARENVVLNGVMMGLGRREARRRLDGVLEFAGLSEFVDLKLKNYSSGMMVRLAFAVMVQADADIMLVDEVIAVGDASFAQRCMDVFRERRRAGKTVVLVTHDMGAVQQFCDRAMLIHDGQVRYLGDPEEAVLEYFRLNFGGPAADGGAAVPDLRPVDVWLEDRAGRRLEHIWEGEPIVLQLIVAAERRVRRPLFGFEVLNVEGVPILSFSNEHVLRDDDALEPGQRLRLTARLENPLVPGRYSVNCSIARNGTIGDVVLRDLRLLDFLIRGSEPKPGMVAVRERLRAVVQ